MNSNPLISILMPAKNAGEYLSACLDSIMAQSYQNWELLVTNDHSTDDTLEILKRYEVKDKRIKVFTNKGQGIIDALRLAYQKSSGELITRMDADDLMSIHKLEILSTNLLSKGKGHLAIGQVKYFSDDQLGQGYIKYQNWLNALIASGDCWQEIYKECVIPSPCWMLHRSDLDRVGAFDSDIYPEDYDLCFRMYAKDLKCIPCSEVLHLWRDYPDRSSRTDEHYVDNRFLDLKLYYFLKLHFDTNRNLVLKGAGTKGKYLAKLLIQDEISFDWICNNPKKIGKDIYGVRLKESSEHLDVQTIIAIANPIEQRLIKSELNEKNKNPLTDYFFFC